MPAHFLPCNAKCLVDRGEAEDMEPVPPFSLGAS
jgi:hypothetical protein